MRHESRTHRVASDMLFDRINLDSKIQTKYVDTKKQLADLLTYGSFTSDEWCNLLRLFSIMNFFMFSRSHFRSIEKATTMSKRIQEKKTEGELVVAKPRPVCLISRNLEQRASLFLLVRMLLTSRGIRSWIQDLRNGDAGNCSKTETQTQKRVLKCGKKMNHTGNCSKVMCVTVPGVAGNCSKEWKSNLKSPGWTTIILNSQIMITLRKSSRISVSRSENDEIFDLKTKKLIWGLYVDNDEIGSSGLIVENSFEILNLSAMICDISPWMRATLGHDQVIK